MSELEKYVRENREQLNWHQPTDGHSERFFQKLDRAGEGENKSRTLFWRIAAALIIALVVSFSILLPKFNSPDDVHYASVGLSDVSSEMANVELYYKSKLAMEYDKIDDLSKSDPIVKSYLDEIEKLSADYTGLESKLYESGQHEKVVLAMIENFRLRLNLMEKLEAEKAKQTKKDSI